MEEQDPEKTIGNYRQGLNMIPVYEALCWYTFTRFFYAPIHFYAFLDNIKITGIAGDFFIGHGETDLELKRTARICRRQILTKHRARKNL